ncbi:MAG: YihY/virulence factor BrkB family protein [Sporichthyaceae bacterium]
MRRRHRDDRAARDEIDLRDPESDPARPAGQVSAGDIPGGDAERPREIPRKGWFQILRRAWKEARADQVPLMAAGVAFYAFLAIFPAIIAAVLLYGLLADPSQVSSQVDQFGSALPSPARSLLSDQMTSLTSSNQQTLGIGLVIALLGALWSASGGMGNLIIAVNITYDEVDERNFVVRKGLSLLMTLGAIVFVVVAIALVAVLPAVVNALGLPAVVQVAVEVTRWLGLVLAMMLALAVLYRVAPDRDAPKLRWTSVGAVTATALWVVASIGFSLYVDRFSSYGKTYGSLAGVVVLLLWLWITTYVVLLGAEMNAEAEQQTARDTTTGSPRPMGERGAVKADSVPG